MKIVLAAIIRLQICGVWKLQNDYNKDFWIWSLQKVLEYKSIAYAATA